MRQINKIIIHNSSSEWGDSYIIDKWHKERGFSKIGYHYLVLNGYRLWDNWANKTICSEQIGMIEKGRPDEEIGAHCRGLNSDSIGVCLIGVETFPNKQMSRLIELLSRLIWAFDLEVDDVIGHYETPSGMKQGKTCPNLYMPILRKRLRRFIWRRKILSYFKWRNPF